MWTEVSTLLEEYHWKECVVSLTGYMPKLFSEPHNSINIPSNLNMNEV